LVKNAKFKIDSSIISFHLLNENSISSGFSIESGISCVVFEGSGGNSSSGENDLSLKDFDVLIEGNIFFFGISNHFLQCGDGDDESGGIGFFGVVTDGKFVPKVSLELGN